MALSMFRELLAIKTFREGKAELAVRKQRLVLARAKAERESAERRLMEFRAHAERQERALFDDLCSAIVLLRDIQDVYTSVAAMRSQERDHSVLLDRAHEEQVREQQELDDCRTTHVQATRMKEKFVELARNHAVAQIREVERKEDAEMEEAAEMRKSRAEWGGGEADE
ncbi:type III secretion system stalk subunit SctO [Ramlibacter sp. MAHUQ-53]|uniref:type III secretion system stalk subunit SctO n=1 Tax=unclassified Ramlibacter TaxID=2617605 RepID=UPI00362B9554